MKDIAECGRGAANSSQWNPEDWPEKRPSRLVFILCDLDASFNENGAGVSRSVGPYAD